MNATELVNQYYTWENNGGTEDDETVETYAGGLIARNGMIGALVQCVQYGLEGDYNDSFFFQDVAKVIIKAAGI